MNYDIFISHSSKGSKTAMAIVEKLEADGVKCWVAPRDLDPGSEWAEGIINGIESCSLFLLLLCPEANQSPQVLREVERAVSKKVAVIPVLTGKFKLSKSLEYFVSSHQWLEIATQPSATNLAEISRVVLKKLGRQGGGGAGSKPRVQYRPLVIGVILVFLLMMGGYFVVKKQPLAASWQQVEAMVAGADFTVPITTNKKEFSQGDSLEIRCVPPSKGYLTLFSHTLGTEKVTMLFPNKAHPDNLVKAGEDVQIPGPNDLFSLKADADTGKTFLVAFLHPAASQFKILEELLQASKQHYLEVETNTVIRGFDVELTGTDNQVGAGRLELQAVK